MYTGSRDVKRVTLRSTAHAVTLERSRHVFAATVRRFLRDHGFARTSARRPPHDPAGPASPGSGTPVPFPPAGSIPPTRARVNGTSSDTPDRVPQPIRFRPGG